MKSTKIEKPGIILSIISSKGGVGKTTLTANISGLLADQGSRVLVVDADAQPALSSYYPLTHRALFGLKNLITQASIEEVISTTSIDNLDIIYSDDPKGTLQSYILHATDGRQRLRFTLNQLRDRYDYIIIDTIGTTGPLQETAILASDLLISPIAPDKVSATEFQRGTLSIVNEIRQQGQRIGIHVGPLFGLLYRMERTIDAETYAEALNELLSERNDVHLLDTRVPATAPYKAAATRQLPVHRIDKNSRHVTPCALQVMSDLLREVFSNYDALKEAAK